MRTFSVAAFSVVLPMAGASAQPLQVVPSPLESIEVIGPGTELFQRLVTESLQDAELESKYAETLRYSIVIKTLDSRRIRAICVRFDFLNALGEPLRGVLIEPLRGMVSHV
jgi:hypothetical protein